MKFRRIKFNNHLILGNCDFNFTNQKGETVDTIIIAGENGCGKSVFLNKLFKSGFLYDSTYMDFCEIELCKDEILQALNGQLYPVEDINILKIKYIDNTLKIYLNESSYEFNRVLLDFCGNFPRIFSDVEINFGGANITQVTSKDIDEPNSRFLKSTSDLSKEISQLLIDIKSLDDADLSDWVHSNPGSIPPHSIQQKRIKRFTNAFHQIFEHKRFKNITNENGRKNINFEEFGRTMSIDQLSSGEKQIVFRGGFLLKDKKSTEGAYILIDEPEISLHPKWQMKILPFIKGLFTNEEGIQTSQIIIATHSPFIIHNLNRNNDKVIILQRNEEGQIEVAKEPMFYSWTPQQLVQNAFNINMDLDSDVINVFVEGETDEQYYNKALEVYGFNKTKISFKWIGQYSNKGKAVNTGDTALNNAAAFFTANMQFAKYPIVLLYDCDTRKPESDDRNLHIRMMKKNESNNQYKKGVENLLILPSDFKYEKYYKTTQREDDYGAESTIGYLDKTELCDYICSLDSSNLENILENFKNEINKLLLIK